MGAILCPAGAESIEPAPNPMFWILHDRRPSILVGSVHFLPEVEPQLRRFIDEVLPSADLLILEADVADRVPDWGVLQAGALSEMVSRSTWARVRALASRMDIDSDYLNTLQPWAAGQCLAINLIQQTGAEFGLGVDSALRAAAEAQRKRIEFLETTLDQHRACEAAPIEEQIAMLEYVLDHPERAAADFKLVREARSASDLTALEAFLADRVSRFPHAFEHLIERRNRSWVPHLRSLLQSEYRGIVVVGALHLVGPTGLLALMQAQGCRIDPWRAG